MRRVRRADQPAGGESRPARAVLRGPLSVEGGPREGPGPAGEVANGANVRGLRDGVRLRAVAAAVLHAVVQAPGVADETGPGEGGRTCRLTNTREQPGVPLAPRFADTPGAHPGVFCFTVTRSRPYGVAGGLNAHSGYHPARRIVDARTVDPVASGGVSGTSPRRNWRWSGRGRGTSTTGRRRSGRRLRARFTDGARKRFRNMFLNLSLPVRKPGTRRARRSGCRASRSTTQPASSRRARPNW